VSIAVALLSAYACLAFHALLAVYYAFDPISRRSARSTDETGPAGGIDDAGPVL
jgi:hypothetical protein